MNKLKVKKGDNVIVITGKDKGKSGEVVSVFPKTSRVVIRGVNIAKDIQLKVKLHKGELLTKSSQYMCRMYCILILKIKRLLK